MEGGVWGIIIIISAFMIQVFAFGVSACIGVYNIEFLDYFQVSAAEVSLIASLNYGVFLGSGPIVSFLMTKFTFRKIAIGGSFLVILGLLAVPLFPYLQVMYLTLGVLTGFGSCCVYIPSHTLSGLYYDKNRSLATGIATSGSGLGGAIMPIVGGLIIGVYTWKGSFIILAGLCLHLFIFAGLLRSPPVSLKEPLDGELLHSMEKIEIDSEPFRSEKSEKKTSKKALDLSNTQEKHDFINVDMTGLEYIDKMSWRVGAGYLSTENLQHAVDDSKSVVRQKDDPETRSVEDMEGDHLLETSVTNDEHVSQNCFQMENSSVKAVEVEETRKKSFAPDVSRHIHIFKSYNFDIYFLNNVFWNMGSAIMLAFVPEYLRLQNMSPMQAAVLTGVLGFGGFIGGIAGGVLGNLKRINRMSLYTLANLGMAIAVIVLPLESSTAFYVCLLFAYGLFFGIVLGLLIVVLTDLVGIEGLGNGMGFLMFANGVGTLSGPILAGMIIDISSHFEMSIYFSGVLSIVGTFVILLIPLRRYFTSSKRTFGDVRNGTTVHLSD